VADDLAVALFDQLDQRRAFGPRGLHHARLVVPPERGGVRAADGRVIGGGGRPHQTPIFSAS
jgi:hypothetical protein